MTTPRWNSGPAVALRQSGFPVDLLDPLAAPQLSAAVRSVAALKAESARAARSKGDPRGRADSHAATTALDRGWRDYCRMHAEELRRGRQVVIETFQRDPALRDVLFLSNDSHFPRYDEWLRTTDPGVGWTADRQGRRMADLLTMYLQRVATKNDTAAHYGPISAGRFTDGPPGIRWTTRPEPERWGFFTHWAAEALGDVFARRATLREAVRPRRRPLSFVGADGLTLYSPTTRTGHLGDWRFQQIDNAVLDPAGEWLLRHADGTRSLARLREMWPYEPERLDAMLDDFARRDWLVHRFEVPVGTAWPLRDLRAVLPAPEHDADAGWAHDVLTALETSVAKLPAAAPAHRGDLLRQMKDIFREVTELSPNRGEGRHYADRSVYYEECLGRADDLELGPDLHDLVTRELAFVYDLTLAVPRRRMRQEAELLRDWFTRRFEPGEPVSLGRFYQAFFAEYDMFDAACARVDEDLRRLDDDLTATLLDCADPDASEVSVPKERLTAWLSRQDDPESAVCNADILLAAASRQAVADGDFLAIVGECHAVREALTHTSFTPLLEDRIAQLADATHAAYGTLLDDDEVLCDLVRSHANKTGSQVEFPCLDLEITGRSRKDRGRVLQPSSLYLVDRDGRLELRAHGVDGRLRLLTAPAGGPSIRTDPLALFAFPRSHGGPLLRARTRSHLPRIRSGRVVLSRETWRVPTSELRGQPPVAGAGDRDATDFYAVQLTRDRRGMPRRVFAKLPTEPKPVFVDFDSPMLVRQLCRLARRAESVEFSEMFPDPESLWLQIDGRGHTSELRCALFFPKP